MVGILSTILSVGIPVARVAAQVLPAVLNELSAKEGAKAASSGPVTTGMLEWLPDDREAKIYCVNTSNKRVVTTFQQDVEVDGAFGVESESFEIPTRSTVDVTDDMATYGKSGQVSANYMETPALGGEEMAGGLGRRAVVMLPFVAPLVFTLFGGSISLERGTNGTTSFWRITSSSRLLNCLFDYRSAAGTQIHVEANLKDSEADAEAVPYTYQVDMPPGETSTGMLVDFSLTLIAEEEAMQALLSKRETIAIDDLPEHLRARLSAA